MLRIIVIIFSIFCFGGCQDNAKEEILVENKKINKIQLSTVISNITNNSTAIHLYSKLHC